jgi:2-polyprenyl-3-methyl-5-hydroxy-6-metoxy-1,4-benzoquinol methylase
MPSTPPQDDDEDLDGIDPENPLHSRVGPKPSRLFAYDWSNGFVSPFKGNDDHSFVTPLSVVEALLEHMQQIDTQPQLVDLGSGDGRLCHEAARQGISALGVELDEALVRAAEAAAADEGLESCHFRCMDCTSYDCMAALPSPPTVVTYLLPAALTSISRRLMQTHMHGRLYTIRWCCSEVTDDVEGATFDQLRLERKLSFAPDWPVYEYSWGNSTPPGDAGRTPAVTTEPQPSGMRMCTTAPDVDMGDEWHVLFGDIFAEPPLVSPLDASVELTVGSVALRLVQSREVFSRKDGASAAEGERGLGPDDSHVTGALVWDASIVLAGYLSAVVGSGEAWPTGPPAGARCVELGCGLGLAGLAAAALGLQVTLTDRLEVMPLTEASVAANVVGVPVAVAPLSWGDADAARALRKDDLPFECVLMADVVYEPLLVEPLLESVRALSGWQTVILLSYDTAHGRWDAYRCLKECASRWFEWHDLEQIGGRSKDTVKLVRLALRRELAT